MVEYGIKGSFEGLIKYLEDYKISEVLKKQSLIEGLKILHKRLYALLCWKVEFNRQSKNTELHKWYDECVSDFIQIIPLLVQGFYKICNTSHRSAIENLIRCVVISGGHNPSDFQTVYQLFEKAKEVAKASGNNEFKSRIDKLYQIYVELCNYVHTSGEKYSTFAQALNEYPNFIQEKFNLTVEYLIQSLKIINVIMIIIENQTFRAMYHQNKEAILDNMTAEEKRLFN